MLFKIFVIVMLLGIVISLFAGLFSIFRDRGGDGGAGSRKTARALTVRIALSLLLFSILILGYHWGWYSPPSR